MCLLPFISYGQIGFRKADTALVVTVGGMQQIWKSQNYHNNALSSKESVLNISDGLTRSFNNIKLGGNYSGAIAIGDFNLKSSIKLTDTMMTFMTPKSSGNNHGFLFSNSSHENSLAVQNRDSAWYSAVRLLDYKGWEKSAYGYGNQHVVADPTLNNTVYLEVSDVKGRKTAPRFILYQSTDYGNPSNPYYYGQHKFAMEPDGQINIFKNLSYKGDSTRALFNTRDDRIKIGAQLLIKYTDKNDHYWFVQRDSVDRMILGLKQKGNGTLFRSFGGVGFSANNDETEEFEIKATTGNSIAYKGLSSYSKTNGGLATLSIGNESESTANISQWNFQRRDDDFFGAGVRGLTIWADRIGDGYYAPILLKSDGNLILSGANNSINKNVIIGNGTDNGSKVQVIGSMTVSSSPINPTNVVRKAELDLKAPIISPSFSGTTRLTVVEYVDNAAAIAGGLSIGSLYRTGDLLKVVH